MSAGAYDLYVYRYTTIPEPGTMLLAALASAALLSWRRSSRYRC
jgi:hypothetical protein